MTNEVQLINDIASMKTFPHVKGKQYSKEECDELKILLDKYPKSHTKIRKILKIPSASFIKLKSELSDEEGLLKYQKRKSHKR